jgi:hypothetical protein
MSWMNYGRQSGGARDGVLITAFDISHQETVAMSPPGTPTFRWLPEIHHGNGF